MPALFPVTAGRTSELLSQQRLLNQVAGDQVDLLKKQDQISTGRRFLAPSEDAGSAQRAVSLQRLLEQKTQISTNLLTSDSYLGASDNAVSDVADLLISVRATALGISDTTSSDVEREAASAVVKRAIEQLAVAVNKQFRGRYLFGGSEATDIPFLIQDDYVLYQGNETSLRSFSELNSLLDTNVNGNQVVGAFSPEVRGTVDLNPVINVSTRLSELRSGEGIAPGAIEISDGTNAVQVDISTAETIGDVIRLIESQPPAGRTISAQLTAGGLRLEFADGGGGNLTVREVNNGVTAEELGIFNNVGVGTQPLIGLDLNPVLTPTTSLDDLLGVRTRITTESIGENNDIVLTARQPGTATNTFQLSFVDDDLLQAAAGLSPGSETVNVTSSAISARAALTFLGSNNDLVLTATQPGSSFNNVDIQVLDAGAIGNAATVTFDPAAKTLQIGIDSGGQTEIQTVINEINLEGNFSAGYDASDPADGGFVGTTQLSIVNAGNVSGDTGNSGAAADTIQVHINASGSTANDVIKALQNTTAVTDLFDVDLDDLDTSATLLAGRRTVDVDALIVRRDGSGVAFDRDSGIQIENGDQTYTLTFESAETVQDVLNAINGSPAGVLAELNAAGDGIDVRSRLSGADFSLGENGGTTARHLGLRTLVDETRLEDLNHGRGVRSLDGDDFYIVRSDGTEFAVDVSTADTIGDVIDLINNHVGNQNPATRITARHKAYGNGIELIRDDPSGGTPIAVRAGTDAPEDLGLLAVGEKQADAIAAVSAAAAISFASPNETNTAFTVTANQAGTGLNDYAVEFRDTLAGNFATATLDVSGQRLIVDLDAANTTTSTIIAAIASEGTFSAALDATNDPGNDGSGIPAATGVVGTTAGGAAEAIVGRDTNPIEVRGAFNSLLRLNKAIEDFDIFEIERAIIGLDEDFDRLNFARAEIGTRQQQVEAFRDRIATEEIELQQTLSLEIDVDLTEAISQLLQRQAAYQASLQLMGQTFQLSLLDFI